jgi:hypothetical protein
MDVRAIRDHLCLARFALGPDHPLSARIKTVERHLTPGDLSWHGDAVIAQNALVTISADLEQLPGGPPDVNEAIKQIADAIELL